MPYLPWPRSVVFVRSPSLLSLFYFNCRESYLYCPAFADVKATSAIQGLVDGGWMTLTVVDAWPCKAFGWEEGSQIQIGANFD